MYMITYLDLSLCLTYIIEFFKQSIFSRQNDNESFKDILTILFSDSNFQFVENLYGCEGNRTFQESIRKIQWFTNQ